MSDLLDRFPVGERIPETRWTVIGLGPRRQRSEGGATVATLRVRCVCGHTQCSSADIFTRSKPASTGCRSRQCKTIHQIEQEMAPLVPPSLLDEFMSIIKYMYAQTRTTKVKGSHKI